MFGTFGRKKIEREILPAEMWAGEIGKTLADAGLSPNDPANEIAFDNEVEARFAQARVALELQLEAQNLEIAAKHPGCSLAPMFIFTEGVWSGRHQRLLSETLSLTPYDKWNVRILAADKASARALGIDRVYPAEIPHFVEALNEILDKLAAEHSQAVDFRSAMTRDIWGLSNEFWVRHIQPGLAEP